MSGSSFSFYADRRFIRQVIRSVTPKRLRHLNIVVGALAALVVYALVAGQPWLGFLAGVGGLVALVVARGAQRPMQEVQDALGEQFGSLPPPGEVTVTVDDAGMRFTDALGIEDVPWERIASVRRTRAVWFVNTVGGSMLPLPAASIPGDVAAIIAERTTVTAEA